MNILLTGRQTGRCTAGEAGKKTITSSLLSDDSTQILNTHWSVRIVIVYQWRSYIGTFGATSLVPGLPRPTCAICANPSFFGFFWGGFEGADSVIYVSIDLNNNFTESRHLPGGLPQTPSFFSPKKIV